MHVAASPRACIVGIAKHISAARGWCSPCSAPPRCERSGARRAYPTAAAPQGSHGNHARCFPIQAWDGAVRSLLDFPSEELHGQRATGKSNLIRLIMIATGRLCCESADAVFVYALNEHSHQTDLTLPPARPRLSMATGLRGRSGSPACTR